MGAERGPWFNQWAEKAGMPPGTLVHVGEEDAEPTAVTVHDYGPEHVDHRTVETVDEAAEYVGTDSVTWINLSGLRDVAAVADLGEAFGIHQLLQEDILNTEQRPKLEEYDDHLFLLLKMFYYPDDDDVLHMEQVSLVLGEDYVLSFQESGTDVFDAIRTQLDNAQSKLRNRGPDYLAYTLLDAVVDNYFVVMEQLGEDVERLEASIVEDPENAELDDI